MGPDSALEQVFVWPPRPVEGATPAITEPETPRFGGEAAPTILRWVRWGRQIEGHWLVPTALPLAQRIEQIGWSPDALGDYCERCGSTIGPHESDEFGCAECRGMRPPWARFTRLGSYEGALAEWVREVKFQRSRWLGASLGVELARALRRAGLEGGDVRVVPVPTSTRRRLSRGIDHTLAIARGVARELDAKVVRGLTRVHRPSQLSVAVSQRAGNVSGAIRPAGRRSRRGLEGGWVILIDDVTTTGATLRAAARALRRAGVPSGRIWAGVLAVTPSWDRTGPVGEEPRGSGVDNGVG